MNSTIKPLKVLVMTVFGPFFAVCLRNYDDVCSWYYLVTFKLVNAFRTTEAPYRTYDVIS
jgi:hypothetical protein